MTVHGSWDLCYGRNGHSDPSAANLEIALDAEADVFFTFNTTTHICTAGKTTMTTTKKKKEREREREREREGEREGKNSLLLQSLNHFFLFFPIISFLSLTFI